MTSFYGYEGKPADWQARQERLRGPLAQAIKRLALSPAEIAALPDTYSSAVRSREFAVAFDPAAPERPCLPPVPEGHPNLQRFQSVDDGSQSSFEFLLSRARLLDGLSGGLHAVGGERDFLTGFSTHGVDPFDPQPGEAPEITAARPKPAHRTALVRSSPTAFCANCHFLPGVFSFNTFVQNYALGRPDGPPPLSAMPVDDVLASAVEWKRHRTDWLLLKRLMSR